MAESIIQFCLIHNVATRNVDISYCLEMIYLPIFVEH